MNLLEYLEFVAAGSSSYLNGAKGHEGEKKKEKNDPYKLSPLYYLSLS